MGERGGGRGKDVEKAERWEGGAELMKGCSDWGNAALQRFRMEA